MANDFLDDLQRTEFVRPAWEQIWMEVVETIEKRSSDPNYKVASIIVTHDNTQLLALGYNGGYAGGPNQRESEEPGESGFIHAEVNALIKLDYNNPKKKIMYVSMSPCKMCAKAIVNAGISEVIYREDYRDHSGIVLLQSAGIQVRRINSKYTG
jgi:dCMP deaminase